MLRCRVPISSNNVVSRSRFSACRLVSVALGTTPKCVTPDTTSAVPVVWTYAPYVRLEWSNQTGQPEEQPSTLACRYAATALVGATPRDAVACADGQHPGVWST